MNLEKRMFLAKALLKYAQMHGYISGRRGKKPTGVSSYTRIDCAQQFNIPQWYINDILRQNKDAIENIPHEQMIKLRMKLIDVGMLDGDKIVTDIALVSSPSKESKMQITHDGPEKDVVVSEDAGTQINKLSPELSNEIHNSNRILKMDARMKEIKDYIQNYRNAYRDEMIAAWTVFQARLALKEDIFPDPIYVDLFKERTAFVDVLDIIIEKLDKI